MLSGKLNSQSDKNQVLVYGLFSPSFLVLVMFGSMHGVALGVGVCFVLLIDFFLVEKKGNDEILEL
jgi:hypothetical protein